MALIKCPECGREVSNKATSCPNCGYEVNKSNGEQSSKSNKKWIVILLTVIAVLACGVGAWWILSSDETSKANEAATETTICEENEEKEDAPMGVIAPENFLSTETIEWCGSNQLSPILVSDNSDIIASLKQLGFNVINQENETFEGEGGEPYTETITTLMNGYCKIVTNGHDITITFENVSDANKFINEAKEMGFRKSFEYEGCVDYSWVLKDFDGTDMEMNSVGDIFISQEGDKVSIYTAQP